MKPELSVITTWCNRPELARTLAENRLLLDQYDAEAIVVNCAGSQADLRKILAGPRPRRVRCVEMQTTVFNKALALNLGISIAESDRLFLLDADIVLTEDFLSTAFDTLAAQHFFTVDCMFDSEPEAVPDGDQLEEMVNEISFTAKGGRKATARVRRNLHESHRSGLGQIMLARKHFLEVGGMNADLSGYGWEDRDLLLRLQFALGLEERSAGSVLHLSHKNAAQHPAWQDRQTSEHLNFVACFTNYRAGHYTGTYYDDVSVWKEKISVEDFD